MLMSKEISTKKPLLLAILAGIGASACCLGPFLLLSLGIGGAWMSHLTSMQAYSPYLTGFTLLVLALVFRQLYLKPQKCEDDAVCANPKVKRNQRIIFWVISVILIGMMSFPYYAHFLLD